MRITPIVAGLLVLAAAPVLAVQHNPAEFEPLAQEAPEASLIAWGSDDERLDRLKEKLGFTGEVVAWVGLPPTAPSHLYHARQ